MHCWGQQALPRGEAGIFRGARFPHRSISPTPFSAAAATVRAAYHQQLLAAGADAVIGATAELVPEQVFQLLLK